MAAEIGFDKRLFLDLIAARKWDELAAEFLSGMKWLNQYTVLALTGRSQEIIDDFVRTFLDAFLSDDFKTTDENAEELIRANPDISYLVAMSTFRTTDAWLLEALGCNAFAKILTLYSPRNNVEVETRKLFDVHAGLASLWYSAYAAGYRGAIHRPEVSARLRRHYAEIDGRLVTQWNPQELAFSSTYVDPACDKPIKQAVNRGMRSIPALRGATIVNRPDPRKIAVISGFWRRGHSVHRTLRGYVAALRPDYHVTLVNVVADDGTGKAQKEQAKHPFDTGMFDEVKQVTQTKEGFDFAAVMRNDWGAIYYPDVGMTIESLMLANLRLAPVQLMGTGHPVSTHGSEIDYFVSGAEVEQKGAQRYYSERLVLLPGLGAVYDRPTLPLTGRTKATDNTLIACSWAGQKISEPLVVALREIVRRSGKRLHFRIFPSSVLSGKNAHLSFFRDLGELLAPSVIEIIHYRDYPEYMALMEECDFALDCFPFGGSNTVSDLLHLRKPVVCFEADRWPGRIGAALLRRAELPDLVATTESEYVEIACQLVRDERYRAGIVRHLTDSSLDAIYSMDDAAAFKDAVDYLIENHSRLRRQWARDPIRVREEELVHGN